MRVLSAVAMIGCGLTAVTFWVFFLNATGPWWGLGGLLVLGLTSALAVPFLALMTAQRDDFWKGGWR